MSIGLTGRDGRIAVVVDAGGVVFHDGRHAWLRVVLDKIVSWDFRKMAG